MTCYQTLLESGGYPGRQWFSPGNWQELFLIAAAIRTGLWDALTTDQNHSIEELAGALHLDHRATGMVLEAMATSGYVDKKSDSFEPTEEAIQKLGTESTPGQLRFTVLHLDRLAQRWTSLPSVMEEGQPLPGNRFTETVESFVKAMDAYAGPTAEEAVTACLKRAPLARAVLDIGAATGTVSKLFAGKGLDVTMFDIPEVIELAEREISGVENISFHGGDFNEAVPTGPFDLAFLGNVVHIYSEDHNRKLLKRVADSLSPGGLIAILDYVRNLSHSAPYFGINMLVNTAGGDAWTDEQYRRWLEEAGFGEIEFVNMEARDQQLVVGRLPR